MQKGVKVSNERVILELFQESINVPNTSDQELNEEEEEIFSDEEGEEETIERSAPLKYPETLSPRKTPTPLTPSDSTMSSPGRMPLPSTPTSSEPEYLTKKNTFTSKSY